MPKTLATCVVCSAEFGYYPCASKGRFCSYRCYWQDLKDSGFMKGNQHGKGNVPWNKGKTGVYSEETRRAIAMGNRRPKHSAEEKARIAIRSKGNTYASAGKGRTQNAEWVKKRADAIRGKPNYKNRGANSSAWKGGVDRINSTKRKQLMRSLEYVNWRRAVFERDGYACVRCGLGGGKYLHADHIKPYALFPELALDTNNGQTLCVSCHKVKTREDRSQIRAQRVTC